MLPIILPTKKEWFVDIVGEDGNTIVSVFHSNDPDKAYKVYEQWNNALKNPDCIYYTDKSLDVQYILVEEPYKYDEFQLKVYEALQLSGLPEADRDNHTLNELLFVLNFSSNFKDMNINISIKTQDDNWICVPTIDSFVPVRYRDFHFNISDIEYERETVGEEFYDNITIYESEE